MKPPRALKTASQTRIALMLAGSGLCGAAMAAGTDISSVPLFTATNVKPNFMFLMDDSASMLRWWLPDQASPWAPAQDKSTDRDPLSPAPNAYYEESKISKIFKYGQYSTQCNYLAYNPATTYLPPLDEQGIPQPPGRMSDFKDEKYQPFYFTYKGKEPVMGFKWVNGEVQTNSFYYQCNSLIGQGDGAGVFDRVEVAKLSDWQKQNFQNWRYYYSTRREMAKAAIKQVFRRVKDDYRVGYSRTSYDKAVDLSSTTKADRWKFLDILDFDDNQKLKFFGAIHNSDGGFNTPIRGALSKAGQYFANKAPLQSRDPVQHSCQRNFTLLATDGGWTKAGERTKGGEYFDFGPYGVTKTMATPLSVGQQDTGADVKRPMRDSGGDKVETLADVSAYYYNTDLRSDALENCKGDGGNLVCKNNVKGETADAFHSFGDSADYQHMTTMTLGLGLNGNVAYRPDYKTATTATLPRDFYDIVKGPKNWPAIADPGDKNDYLPLTHNDDLWHAAVNGRGQYFSASDPTSLIRSLSEALDIVKASTGAASAASTSTIRPTGDNNDAFVASYVSQKWIGDVQRFRVNPKTGALENLTWSARTELDNVAAADRNIFYKKPDSNTNRAFTVDNLRDDRLGRNFRDFCDKPGASGNGNPDQCEMLAPEELDAANKTENLVKFIRGDKSMSYYRKRESTLGDITNASLLYAGSPSFPYQDPTYVNYKKEPASVNRPKIVLAAANDGMLHAFDRETGAEKWAFIPSAVMPNLYKLADTNYPNNHAAFVDATPVLADVYIDKGKGEGKKWYSIVVGGLGSGGRGYYALDITDPLKPEILWEYSDKDHPDLGLSFGNPIVTKRQGKDGKWVVVFASGMNNASGVGKLFVLDAATGKLDIKEPLTTGVGNPDGQSGLTYINAWVTAEGDNQALRFYGGDLWGNLWRFDIDGLVEPKGAAQLLAKLVGPGDNGRPQPVTTKPSLAEVKYNGIKYAMVYVATGKYLGISDLSDKSFQSFYAIKDPLAARSWGKVRGSFDFVENTIVAGTATNGDPTRQVSSTPVDLSSKGGWYVDFPVAGERVSVAPSLALGAIYVPVNSPAPYTCQVGGSSFLYRFDILTGSGTASFRGDVLIQGLSVIQLTDGPNKGGIAPMSTGSDGSVRPENENPPTFGVGLKRASWRELVK
ncbi:MULTISPECIES: pilus assembly protein [Variovorax]|uniref:pilus assembly protein n=1 Tax=Variovorax TaxID=34072 RepID=UPI00285E841D|nr:PilC/PilY family type IV pilus protein [Variovorax sp. 3319]MDR6890694.1 type IV pilus assembly protein PilY1 [Variovorax sp. 3319]